MDDFSVLMPFSEGADTSSLYDEQVRAMLGERKLMINSEITDTVFENVALRILQFNQEDDCIDNPEWRRPIWLYINSVGGDVFAGMNLINVIRASKTPVYTVCFAQCASMAFHIFIAGHKRFSFADSVLMLHDGEISIANTDSKVRDFMHFSDALNERLKRHVLKHTAITEELYDKNHSRDWYFFADTEGKELGCVDYVIGKEDGHADIDLMLNHYVPLNTIPHPKSWGFAEQ